MLTTNEIGHIVLAIILFTFIASFPNLSNAATMLLYAFIIIFIYVLAKKFIAYSLETETEIKIWSFQRWGIYERSYFKNPIPAGIIFPFLLSLLSFGYIRLLTLLSSEEKATTARAAKRHDFYSFSELTEWHIGLISSAGIFASLILAILAYFINFPELAKFAIFYASANLIPLGKLDGTKIFFGSKILWAFLVIVCLIALGYVFFLP